MVSLINSLEEYQHLAFQETTVNASFVVTAASVKLKSELDH